MFSAVNMKNCGRPKIRKHRNIKGSYKYVTLEISLKIDSMDKMIITFSESKEKFGNIGHTNTESKGMPSEMSVRSTFQRLSGSLKNYLMKVMRRRVPNISLMTAAFT